MNALIEITKEAAWQLIGNEELSWRDYKTTELTETSYYYNLGVSIQVVTNYIGNITQYYIEDINL